MGATKSKTPTPATETDLDGDLSDEAMNLYLAEHHDDVEAKLKAAYEDRERGDFALLEPVTVLLREARERLETDR